MVKIAGLFFDSAKSSGAGKFFGIFFAQFESPLKVLGINQEGYESDVSLKSYRPPNLNVWRNVTQRRNFPKSGATVNSRCRFKPLKKKPRVNQRTKFHGVNKCLSIIFVLFKFIIGRISFILINNLMFEN